MRVCVIHAMEWGQYLSKGVVSLSRPRVHDICGRVAPAPMPGKPAECLATEVSVIDKPGDVYIVTFPKTGTTLMQLICHLLRTSARDGCTDFDDIHQVVPHSSSAWFIDQNLNAEQPGNFRLFKTHRYISQVAPRSRTAKYIGTVRNPKDTLLSLYRHQCESGKFGLNVPSIEEYASSPKWQVEHLSGCIGNIWNTYVEFWKCR